jgi:hypothetical protein
VRLSTSQWLFLFIMKHLLIIILALPFFCVAQDCKLKKTKDQFSQEPKLSTGFASFSVISLSIDADSKEIDFLFSINNKSEEKCFDDVSTISFIYEGKQKATFRNTGTMNCQGLFHVTFKNLPTTPGPLQKLVTKKLTGITLTGNNKTITTVTLGAAQQQEMMDMIACIVKEGKSLIK